MLWFVYLDAKFRRHFKTYLIICSNWLIHLTFLCLCWQVSAEEILLMGVGWVHMSVIM